MYYECNYPNQGPAPASSSSSSRPSATTLMLLAVSFYLIITTLPVTVCYVLHLTFPAGDDDMPDAERATDPVWSRYLAYNNIRTIIYEIGLSHYACNFYIYLATGRMFRRELRRILCRRCPAFGAGNGSSASGRRSLGQRMTRATSPMNTASIGMMTLEEHKVVTNSSDGGMHRMDTETRRT